MCLCLRLGSARWDCLICAHVDTHAFAWRLFSSARCPCQAESAAPATVPFPEVPSPMPPGEGTHDAATQDSRLADEPSDVEMVDLALDNSNESSFAGLGEQLRMGIGSEELASWPEIATALDDVAGTNLSDFIEVVVDSAMSKEEGLHVLASPWSTTWEGWRELKDELSTKLAIGLLGDIDACTVAEKYLKRFFRIVTDNEDVLAKSDEDRLLELKARGLRRERGLVFGRNDCLSDSLLQCMAAAGMFSRPLAEQERNAACRVAREALVFNDDVSLRPRRRDPFTGEDEGEHQRAFLQHDIHAEPVMETFLEHFEGILAQDAANVAVQLIVYTRFDSDTLPPTESRIRGDFEANGTVQFQLYSNSGEGISGVHYDPLFPVEIGHAVSDGGSDREDAGDKSGPAGSAEELTDQEAEHSNEDISVPSPASQTSCAGEASDAEQRTSPLPSASKGVAQSKPKWATPAPAEADPAPDGGGDNELESLSDDPGDRSDDSDVFHAAVRPDRFSTREDCEHNIAVRLSKLLRDRPLLPPHPADPTLPWLDVSSGISLPVAHCAFSGCGWTGDHSDDIDRHICDEHAGDFEECGQESVPRDPERTRVWEWRARGFYARAIEIREQENVPLLGPSVDRRTVKHLMEVYNDDAVKCLICFVCGCKKTTMCATNQDIGYVEQRWFETLTDKSLAHNLQFATFRSNYMKGPLEDPPGLRGTEWRRTLLFEDRRTAMDMIRATVLAQRRLGWFSSTLGYRAMLPP